MRNYMKKNEEKFNLEAFKEGLSFLSYVRSAMCKKRTISMVVALLLLIPIVSAIFTHRELKNVTLSSEGLIQLSANPIAATSSKKSVISIPAGTVKANPFVPYRDLGNTAPVADVPKFNLVEPPEVISEGSDAARVMDTSVSGILYDKFSPSAILNIEGNDYLVKKGDVVNNYKVLSIMQDSVTVKLGANVYKAGIGEILTEGTLNHNDVANLNKKFGGVK